MVVRGRMSCLLILLSLLSCTERIDAVEPVDEELVEVEFLADFGTRSLVSVDGDMISDFKVFAYRNGELEKDDYVYTGAIRTKLKLVQNCSYDLYAVANAGDVSAPRYKSDMDAWSMAISSISELEDGILMAWKQENVSFSAPGSVNVMFERLVSEYSFRVDPGLLAGFEITSIRLVNAASRVAPFVAGGSKVISTADTIIGDRASASDLATLNAGGSIKLYALENCQGTLLPASTAPSSKVPGNLSHPELCTYLEVSGKFSGASPLEGTVLYRMYLGEDNCSNFDIRRNTKYNLTLCLTPDGLDELSWRVDKDADYKSSLGSWQISEGLHYPDDLYIGEIIQIEIILDDALISFLDSKLMDCTVRYGNGTLALSGLQCDPIFNSGGDLFCNIHCTSLASGSENGLYLYDPNGRLITNLVNDSGRSLTVKKPYLRRTSSTKVIPSLNGPEVDVPVYLTDYKGGNLLSPDMYGFDTSLFSDLALTVSQSPSYASTNSSLASQINNSLHNTSTLGEEFDGGPFVTYHLSLTNSGTSSSLNREWSRLYGADSGQSTPLWYCSVTSDNAASLSIPASFEILPIQSWYYGSLTQCTGLSIPYTAAANDSYLAFYNPSNVAIDGKTFLSATHNSSMSSLSGYTQVKYLTSDTSVPSEIVGSTVSFTENAAVSSLYYTSTIDGKSVRCYPLIKNSGSTYGSIKALYDKVLTLGTAWRQCQMDIFCQTTSGRRIEVPVTSIYDMNSTSDGSYAIAERNYLGTVSWTVGGEKVNQSLTPGTFLSNYTSTDLSVAHTASSSSSSVCKFNLYMDSTQGVVLEMTGNTLGRTYTVSTRATYTTKSEWQQNKSSSTTTETYSFTATPGAKSVSGTSSSTVLLSQTDINNRFAYMNTNYWHESCTSAINNKYNRFAKFSMPSSLKLEVTIRPNGYPWTPVTLTATAVTSSCSLKTFYSKTPDGTYPSYSSFKNPDGSTRGDDTAINNTASESEYTTSSYNPYAYSATYTSTYLRTLYVYK